MFWVVLVVLHLEARHITVEAVLSGLLRHPVRFLVVLQLAIIHIVLAQTSHLSVHYQHRVCTELHLLRVPQADIWVLTV